MQQTDAISAVWFMYGENGKPLGRLYAGEDAAPPVVGAPIPGDGWQDAEVADVRELAPTCAMRRFRVTLRMRV